MNIHEALIIGGSSGIGKAAANRLLRRCQTNLATKQASEKLASS